MRIPLIVEPSDLQKKVISHYQVKPDTKIIFCQGISHALAEICRGLFGVYSHKMEFAYFSDHSPNFKACESYFAREGVKISTLSSQKKVGAEFVTPQLLSLLMSEDDPLLGVQHDIKDLCSLAADKKVFHIVVSYNKHLVVKAVGDKDNSDGGSLLWPYDLNPYEIRVHVLSNDLVLVLGGSRMNFERLHFGSDSFSKDFKFNEITENKNAVVDFEREISKFAKVMSQVLPSDSFANRIYDRSVFVFSDINGEALIERVFPGVDKTLVFGASSCIENQHLETAWLENKGFTKDQIRGLIVLDQSLCIMDNAKKIESAYREILKIQSGN